MYVKAVMIGLAALALATTAAEAKNKHRHHYRHHHHHYWAGSAHYNAYNRSSLWGDRCTTDEGYGRRLPCEYSGK